MKKISYLIVSLLFLFIACKKEKSEPKLGKIDIADAYSLVLCYNDSVNNNPNDTLKLYKIIDDERLYYVRQYAEDGASLGFTYQPIAIYDLNKEYFLFIVTKEGAATTESYLISKADGTAKEVRDFELPRIANGWNISQANRVFIKANAKNYYYIGNNTINLLSFDEANNPTTIQKADYNANFDIDTLENLISGNNIFYKSGNSMVISEIDENTIVTRNTQQGFYMVKRTPAAIAFSNINVSDQSYTIEARGEIAESTTDWKYLGNVTFDKTKSIVLVYDLGLVYIDNAIQKVFPLSMFSLTKITSYTQSNTLLFINGLNTVQKEVMLKINPQTGTPTFSHILVPERYHFLLYQVDEFGNLSFFARDKVKSTDVIGYLSSAQIVYMLNNSQKLVPRQILSIK